MTITDKWKPWHWLLLAVIVALLSTYIVMMATRPVTVNVTMKEGASLTVAIGGIDAETFKNLIPLGGGFRVKIKHSNDTKDSNNERTEDTGKDVPSTDSAGRTNGTTATAGDSERGS